MVGTFIWFGCPYSVGWQLTWLVKSYLHNLIVFDMVVHVRTIMIQLSLVNTGGTPFTWQRSNTGNPKRTPRTLQTSMPQSKILGCPVIKKTTSTSTSLPPPAAAPPPPATPPATTTTTTTTTLSSSQEKPLRSLERFDPNLGWEVQGKFMTGKPLG